MFSWDQNEVRVWRWLWSLIAYTSTFLIKYCRYFTDTERNILPVYILYVLPDIILYYSYNLNVHAFFLPLLSYLLSPSPSLRILIPDRAEVAGVRRGSRPHRSDDLHSPVPSVLGRPGRPGCRADQLLPGRGQVLGSGCHRAQESPRRSQAALQSPRPLHHQPRKPHWYVWP